MSHELGGSRHKASAPSSTWRRAAHAVARQAPSASPAANLVLNLAASYSKFATELLDLQAAPCSLPAAVKGRRQAALLVMPLEVGLSYMRLRGTPRIVWEISPMHSFTSLMILYTLQKNNNS